MHSKNITKDLIKTKKYSCFSKNLLDLTTQKIPFLYRNVPCLRYYQLIIKNDLKNIEYSIFFNILLASISVIKFCNKYFLFLSEQAFKNR